MNYVHLIGNVGNAPALVTFENGGKLCHFSLATNEKWTNTNGEKVEHTEWHTIVVNNPKTIDVALKHITKGMQLAVVGKIKTQITGEGEARKFFTKIVAREFKFLGKPAGAPAPDASFAHPAAENAAGPADTFVAEGDDDLPF